VDLIFLNSTNASILELIDGQGYYNDCLDIDKACTYFYECSQITDDEGGCLGGYAKYKFTNNNFNGTGNITTSGTINAGILNVSGNLTGYNLIYGGMYNFSDKGHKMILPNSSYYYNITFFSEGALNGFHIKNGYILVAEWPGEYLINGQISAVFGNNGEYGIGISVNQGALEIYPNSKCYTRLVGTAKEQGQSMTCLLRLNVNDELTMMVDDEASPAVDLTIYTLNLNAVRVGN